MKIQLVHRYNDIISIENLLAAWREFVVGKSQKGDVQRFGVRLADNIVQLHLELANKTYRHGGYKSFAIADPKPRQIHKASVRDRVLHHAIYRLLYSFFNRTFGPDSFSCRLRKGTHKAMGKLQTMTYQVSRNHTQTCWILKCDIRKFFASIDHGILLELLHGYIPDKDVIWLLQNVIESFSINQPGKGLPLGNLTSQLFCNIYMNELDQFVKHKLRAKYYARYADDFVLLSEDKVWLEQQMPKISEFLDKRLKLSLHPDKIYTQSLASGLDFLGWVHFPKNKILRTTSKRRMMRRVREHPTNQTLQSYYGLLKHGNTYELRQEVKNLYGLLNGDQRN